MKTKDGLITEIENLSNFLQKKQAEARDDLCNYSDYAMVYGDLRVAVENAINVMESLVVQIKEAKL